MLRLISEIYRGGARNRWNNVRNIHRLTRNVDYSINGEYLMTKIRDGRSCFYYDGPLRDINHLVESNRAINVEREGSRILALDNGESRMFMLRVKYL